MEPISFASFSLAGILATLPVSGEQVSQAVITTHISPAIAGQWEIDLALTDKMSKSLTDEQLPSSEVLTQSQTRAIAKTADGSNNIVTTVDLTAQNTNAPKSNDSQCRELYNFGADNEMRAVSGKELTYGRYIVTHRDEGLPIIAMKTTYDNNEVDCSGNQIDQTDESLIAFLKHDGNNMQWCADDEGEQCFMRFHKVLP